MAPNSVEILRAVRGYLTVFFQFPFQTRFALTLRGEQETLKSRTCEAICSVYVIAEATAAHEFCSRKLMHRCQVSTFVFVHTVYMLLPNM